MNFHGAIPAAACPVELNSQLPFYPAGECVFLPKQQREHSRQMIRALLAVKRMPRRPDAAAFRIEQAAGQFQGCCFSRSVCPDDAGLENTVIPLLTAEPAPGDVFAMRALLSGNSRILSPEINPPDRGHIPPLQFWLFGLRRYANISFPPKT
ncbi:MAG: hypothetical protein H6Q04_389 [Acidobacteria bacterium]|nr:hypothetical protein [Acidobacteriota bacterium]